jgi:hypothetical protein
VMLLTGFGDVFASESGGLDAVDAVVPKPFTKASLRSALSKLTASH